MQRAGPEDSVFREERRPEGRRILPTPYAGGPWSPEHQHGGAVAALLARTVEQVESPVPMRVARLTIDMLRAVPMKPLTTAARVLRAGKRVQGIEALILDGETVVARATALRARVDETLDLLEVREAPDPALGQPPAELPPVDEEPAWKFASGFLLAVDYVGSLSAQTGRAACVWTRLRCPVMDGEVATPLVRLAALADLGSGVGNQIDHSRYTAINPDLSVSILREPAGDWIGVCGVTFRARDGIAQSHAVFHDRMGPVARMQAMLLLDRR
ncbi:MAG: thioesterase family protein [Deltaproteobacteria bacterium]|nr:thioesterase family protein [Deltaproteobacteria bacterium]MBW2362316.1 thioesterase family protein [Deltaproteobacteria bacterium]